LRHGESGFAVAQIEARSGNNERREEDMNSGPEAVIEKVSRKSGNFIINFMELEISIKKNMRGIR